MAFWGGRKKEVVPVEVDDIRVRDRHAPREVHAEKVVIVTGPTVKTVLGFIALGAALGASTAIFLRKQPISGAKDGSSGSAEEATMEGVAARASNLAERAKNLAGRAREAMRTATEVLGPTIQEALGEARSAARQAQDELASELSTGAAGQRERAEPDKAEAKRAVVATGSVAVGVPATGKVEVEVPPNAEIEVPGGTRPVEVIEIPDAAPKAA